VRIYSLVYPSSKATAPYYVVTCHLSDCNTLFQILGGARMSKNYWI